MAPNTQCDMRWTDFFAARALATVDHRRAGAFADRGAKEGGDGGPTQRNRQRHGRMAFLGPGGGGGAGGLDGEGDGDEMGAGFGWLASMPAHPVWLLMLDGMMGGRGSREDGDAGVDFVPGGFREGFVDGGGRERLEERFRGSEWEGLWRLWEARIGDDVQNEVVVVGREGWGGL